MADPGVSFIRTGVRNCASRDRFDRPPSSPAAPLIRPSIRLPAFARPVATIAAAVLPSVLAAQTAPHEYRSLVIAATPALWSTAAYVAVEEHFAMQTWHATERHRGVGISHSFGRHVSAQVDYRYITSGDEIEHRWTPAVNTHWMLADFDLSLRTRAKLREVRAPGTTAERSTRYLERLMVVRPERIGAATIAPFAAVEPSYDSRYSTVNRWEERAGLRIPFHDVTTDLYGLWWEDSRSSVSRYAAAGVELRLTP